MKRAAPAFTTVYAVNVKRYRDALRDAVELPIATRGVLYVLAQWMNTDGTNARPSLVRLAASCQLRQRAVAKHLSDAVKAGYLHRTSSGHKGRTAVYQASIPSYRWDAKGRTLVQPLEVSEPEINPRERRHEDAGYDDKGCTGRPQSLQNNDIKGCTSVQPDLDTRTSPLLRRGVTSPPRDAAGAASQRHDGDLDPKFDKDHDDPDAWLDAHLFGLTEQEWAVANAMMEKRCHPYEIYNTITKYRGIGA